MKKVVERVGRAEKPVVVKSTAVLMVLVYIWAVLFQYVVEVLSNVF